MVTRRDIIVGAGVAAAAGSAGLAQDTSPDQAAKLAPITGDLQPIQPDEFRARIEKAQRLMVENGLGGLVLEPGASMTYFGGPRWGRSERLTALVVPASGDVAVVTPSFEEGTMRERLVIGDDVRTWREHESPFARVVEILNDRGVSDGEIGVEASVRFFVVDGLRAAGPKFAFVSGEDVTLGCRAIKSAHEIELMQAANDVTMAAYRHVYPQVEAGMTPGDIASLMSDAQRALGGSMNWELVLLNEASAYPHGSGQPQTVVDGGVVLMDCGCAVHGYQSDISRTWVHGDPSPRQREVWELVKRGQELALETAQIGAPIGRVDDVVRRMYADAGFGPGYQAPGLTHRLGHGIGMEGHESPNFVKNEARLLEAGMCFSNEPGIYIPGAFGVRMEDCLHMTAGGPHLFSPLAPSLDDPIG